MTFDEWWIHHKPGRPEIKPHEIVQLPSYRSVAEDAYDAGVAHAMARYEADLKALSSELEKLQKEHEYLLLRPAAAEKVIDALRKADDASVLDAYEDYDDVVAGRVQVNAFQAERARAGKALIDALEEYDVSRRGVL